MSKKNPARTAFIIGLIVFFIIGFIGVSFAIDSDNDGMSDLYETIFKLDAADASDAAENYDEDGLNNLQEAEAWTDPMTADTDADGFLDHEDDNPLSRAVVFWGHPDFTEGDVYRYTGPQWWLGAGRDGGEWISSESGWRVEPGASGSLYLDIDRSSLTEDVVLELTHLDVSGCDVSLSLLDTNGAVVLDGVAVSPAGETGEARLDRYSVPLTVYPDASRILLTAQAGSEAYEVYVTMLYVDADGDGLDADQEEQLGTSDDNADSDGDGLSDRMEAVELGSDPMKADTDGDGLTDAQEIEFGSNPASADSDNDGLTDAEECSQLYFLSDNPLTWPEAKAFAEASGGYLAVITSLDELNAVKTALPAVKKARPWMGATDIEEDGVWKWITGESFDYARWGEGEPNNYKEPQMYLRFKANYYWDDASADSEASVLIEYANGLDPNRADTDGDGLSDAREINELKTNAHASDSDGDGISDPNEVARGLDPLKVDTDGDGLEDGEELDMGLDAADPDTDGDGLEDNEELTHRYQVMTAHMTWPAAKIFAEQSGGHLATFASQEEYYAALSACTNARAVRPWLGATDEAEEGVWEWVTGELFDYTRWATNEPNNYKQPEMYLRIGSYAKWYDMGSNTIAGLMIEYEAGLDPKNPDCDSDGLSDGDELKLYGSSARSPDTDGDGISDGDEAAMGINPADRDTDGDGIEDLVEIAAGLNPASSDSDGDGLSDSDEALCIYQLVDLSLTWEESSIVASNFGGHLAVITSYEETYAVASLLPEVKQAHPWIGAYEASDGVWQWVNGEVFDYTRWNKDEPNDYKGPESYVQLITKSLKWNDAGESVTTSLLVEYAEGLDPLNPDSDEDGLLDGEELYTYGTSAHDADSDNDGVSDGDEIALDLDPLDSDTDADGLTDGDESAEGLDPADPASDSDGLSDGQELLISLTDPLHADTDGDGTEDLEIVQTINGSDCLEYFEPYWFSTWSDSGNAMVLSAVCDGSPAIQYQVEVEEAGIYHLGLHVDLSGADTNELNKLPIDIRDILVDIAVDGVDVGTADQCFADELPEYSLFTPWLSEGTHTIKVTFTKETYGISGPCTLELLELGMVDGSDSNDDGYADWMYEQLLLGGDSDGDGLTDAEELELGSNILDSDTDGDGLEDGDEMEAGTDLLDADTDDDGVSDGAEVLESLTDPLNAEFDGTVVNVLTINGCEHTNGVGDVSICNSAVRILPRRGSVEYVFDVQDSDVYRLAVSAAHEQLYNSRPDESRIEIYLDGLYIDVKTLDTDSLVFEDLTVFLPWLNPGEHTIKLYWDNYDTRGALRIQNLRLQEMGGYDADNNGVKDWLEVYLDSVTGIDSVSESYYSPACVEGDARYVSFMEICDGAVAPRQGVDERWFADIPLVEGTSTVAEVSFQNGGIVRSLEMNWVPYNLIAHDGETMKIRKGDELRLTCIDPDYASEDLEQAEMGQFWIDIGEEQYESPDTQPITAAFTNEGTFTVSGKYVCEGQVAKAEVTIKVIDGAFPEESPVCMPERSRSWSCPDLPDSSLIESDETVDLERSGTNMTITAHQTLGEHWLVARLYDDGPILDNIELQISWVGTTLSGYASVVEVYDDMSVWEFVLDGKNLPDDIEIVIESIVSGVVFADTFTTTRTITAADFNELGEYVYQLAVPAGVQHSACHIVKFYQNGVLIGVSYSASDFVPGI